MTITKFATATLLATAFATSSFAGTLTEPMIVEVEEAAAGSSASSSTSSGGGILLPLLGLAVVAALIASDDS